MYIIIIIIIMIMNKNQEKTAMCRDNLFISFLPLFFFFLETIYYKQKGVGRSKAWQRWRQIRNRNFKNFSKNYKEKKKKTYGEQVVKKGMKNTSRRAFCFDFKSKLKFKGQRKKIFFSFFFYTAEPTDYESQLISDNFKF